MFTVSPISPPGGWGSQKPPLGVPIDRTHPLSKGLRFYTPLSEGSGIGVNDLALGRAGLVKNSSTTKTWGTRPGWMTLDGTDDRVDFPSLGVRAGTPLTVAAHIRLTAYSLAYLVNLQRAGDAAMAFLFNLDTSGGNGQFAFSNLGSSNCWRVSVSGTVPLNTEIVLAATYNGGSAGAGIHLYANGVEPAYYTTTDGSAFYDGLGMTCVGGRTYDNARNFNGDMKWAALWDRVLGVAEIQRICREPFCLFAAGEPPVAANVFARPLIEGSLASATPILGAIA